MARKPVIRLATSSGIRSLITRVYHPLTLLLLFFVCNTMLWALIIPRGNGPDELAHIDYIEHLALHGTLPIFGTTPQTTNPNALNPQAMQPPLYYLLATPIRLALGNQPVLVQLRGLRAFSVLIGAGTVALCYRLGRTLVPAQRSFALSVAALVACLPMFTLIGLAVLLCWARLLQGAQWPWLVATGILLGLGLLTKFSILPVAAVTGLLLLVLAWQAPTQRVQKLLGASALVGLPAILISGWSLLRNWQLYGDPTTLMIFERFPNAYRGRPFSSVGSLWDMLFVGKPYFVGFWDGLIHGFWGIFDFYVIYLQQRLYLTLDLMLGIGLVGCFVAYIRARRQLLHDWRWTFVGLSGVLAIAVFYSNISRSYSVDYQPQGRYLFPLLGPLMLLLVGGWEHTTRLLRLRASPGPLLAVVMLLANMVALLTVVAPTYRETMQQRALAQPDVTRQKVYGAFGFAAAFTAPQAKLASFDLLLAVPSAAHGPLIWRLREPTVAGDLATAVQELPLPALNRIALNVQSLSFIPGRTYTVMVQAPWATSDQPVQAFAAAPHAALGPQLTDPNALVALAQAAAPQTGAEQLIMALVLGLAAMLAITMCVPIYGVRIGVPLVFGLAVVASLVFTSTPPIIGQHLLIPTTSVAVQPGRLQRLANQDAAICDDLLLLASDSATVKLPADDSATYRTAIQPYQFTINGETRPVLAMQPPASIRYRISVPPGTQLQTALALNPAVWQPDKGDGVGFSVSVATANGQHEVFRRSIDPKHHSEDRRWIDVTLDLSAYAGQTIDLVLTTDPGPAGDPTYDWAGWAAPVVRVAR